MGARQTKASRNRSGLWPAGWSDEEWSPSLLRAFAKFRKATKLRHVCPSFRMAEIASHWKDFHEVWYWSMFREYVEKTRVSLKPHNNNGTSRADRHTFLIITRSVLRIMQNLSDKSCRENETTHFIFSDFFRKTCRLWDNVEKYCTVGGTVGNMAHAHFTQDT